MIEVKISGPSAEMAKNLINSCIAKLQKIHTELLSASIERNAQQLQILTADIKRGSVEAELLRKKLFDTHAWNAYDATLSATVLKDKSSDLREMTQRRLLLEEQMTPTRTYTTKVINEVYVSAAPVTPKKPLIIGLAIFLGLIGVVVIAFAHHAITKMQID